MSSGPARPSAFFTAQSSNSSRRSLPEIDRRKQHFEKLNAYIRECGARMTSVSGDPDMRFDALPGSPVPEQLRQAGYDVTEIGESQRILPHAITQKFVIGVGGEMEPLTEGSTRPVTAVVTHAGVRTVHQYELTEPTIPPDPTKRIAP